MPFGMGFDELVLILVIVVVVFGATKLPGLEDGLGEGLRRFQDRLQRVEPRPLPLREPPHRRWGWSDWLLVGAALALGAAVIANAVLGARGGR